MRVAFIYFTFGKDEEIFLNSLRSLNNELSKHSEIQADIYVFDQDTLPLSSIPEGVIYSQTSFPRGNNINGFKCIKGMYKCYKEVADKGYKWLIKIDSDVFVKDLSYLSEYDDVASVGGNGWYNSTYKTQCICGACYSIKGETIQKMEKWVKDIYTMIIIRSFKKVYEDDCFSYLTRLSYKEPT